MAAETISGREIDAGLIADWDALCLSTGAESPFLSPWFTASVAAARDDVFVTLLRRDDRLTAVFPHQKTGRRGAAVGTPLNDCQGVITEGGAGWSVSDLLDAAGLTRWDFDHLATGQGPFSDFVCARETSPVIDLSSGLAAWEAEVSRTSKRLKKLRRARRVLARDHGGEGSVTVEILSQDRDALSTAIAWKLDQCLRTGTRPYFSEPWAVETVERLFALSPAAAPGCAGALSVMRVEDRIAAVHFGIRSRDVWHWWFPSYDPTFASYSPGSLLLYEVCAAVAGSEHSQTRIDLGTGESDYKTTFSNAGYDVALGVATSGLRATARARVEHNASRLYGWAKSTPILAPVRGLRRRRKEG